MENLNTDFFFDSDDLEGFIGNRSGESDDPIEETIIDETDDPIEDPIEDSIEDPIEEPNVDDDMAPEIYEANYQFLKDSGYLMVPDDFKFEATSNGWQSALEESNKQMQEIIVQDMFNHLNDEGKLLLNYYLNGGSDIGKFREAIVNDNTNFDIETEDGQRAAVKAYYKETTKLSDEKIENLVEDAFLADRLESEASDAIAALSELKTERQNKLVEEAAAEREAYQQRLVEARNTLSKTLKDNKEIYGIPFSEKDAAIVDTVFKPIKLSDGTVTTEYEYKYAQAMSDPKKVAIIAKLLKNDFDLSFISRPIKNKEVNSFREKLERGFKPGSSKSSSRQMPSSDDFDWDSAEIIIDGKL